MCYSGCNICVRLILNIPGEGDVARLVRCSKALPGGPVVVVVLGVGRSGHCQHAMASVRLTVGMSWRLLLDPDPRIPSSWFSRS